MFWRFGFHNASTLDAIIEKEGSTMENLMGEEELLQEVKAQSPKLIEFICKPKNLTTLLSYFLENEKLDEQIRYKYAYFACEIICCDVTTILDALVDNQENLRSIWTFLDSDDLNPLNSMYFSKMNTEFISKKSTQMLEFLYKEPGIPAKLMKHLKHHAITEFIVKLISLEDINEGCGTAAWLLKEGLITHLINLLDSALPPEVHAGASQTLIDIITLTYQLHPMVTDQMGGEAPRPTNSSAARILVAEMKSPANIKKLFDFMLDRSKPYPSSSLINGITILMELIRKYCSEIETAEIAHQDYLNMLQNGMVSGPFPESDHVTTLSKDLNSIFAAFFDRLSDLSFGLVQPSSGIAPQSTTLGKQIPLGSERLKICELFAEFIHLQYLFTSSPLFDLMVMPEVNAEGEIEENVASNLIILSREFIKENIMVKCIQLFFEFPWNNFIHSVVYDIIAKVFNTYSFTGSMPNLPSVGNGGTTNMELAKEKLQEVRDAVKRLLINIFKDGLLIEQITNAQRLNDSNEARPNGIRLGYMGHLTYISDEIFKLFDKCSQELDADLHDYVNSEDWLEYVTHSLRHTQERDKQSLGGLKPENRVSVVPRLGVIDDDFNMATSNTVSTTAKEEVDNNLTPDSAYNDQLARFLCQQLVKDIPDKFLGAGSSDDEEEKWMGEIDDVGDFDIGEALSHEQLYIQGYAREVDEETMSDDAEFVPHTENEPAADLSFNMKDMNAVISTVAKDP